jgi:hypothetical protein
MEAFSSEEEQGPPAKEAEAMDFRSEGAKATAVHCTGEALRAIEQAQEQLEVAVEELSKVPAMAAERQRLSRLRRQVGRALYRVDDRRTELRRRGALVLETEGASPATARPAELAGNTRRR